MREIITSRQLVLTIATFGITMTISNMPLASLPPGNQDIWIIILLSIVYSTIVRLPILFLINKFSYNTLIETIELILGKIAGKFFGLLYVIYLISYSAFLMVLQSQIVGVNILSRTPNQIIIGLLIITCLYVGSKGLVNICWIAEVITPFSLLLILLMIALGLKNVDFSFIKPILKDSSFIDINKGAIMASFVLNDILIIAKCAPKLENKKEINKIYLYSLLISTVFTIITIVVTQGALGIEQTKHINYPFLTYTRLIKYSGIFERIDAIYVITWVSSYTGRIIFFLYFSYMAVIEVFAIKENKFVFYILGILIGLISLYISNNILITLISSVLSKIIIMLGVVFITIIPTLIIFVYMLRKKTLMQK